ncbi:hypothetical protein G647_03388 [Cladophialophora carrionii CBS 160.54]|uniref:SWIM-type domain-containing protein n=1 Tax=Cladophialophora carrionii CBS 160.54 TaxID=1279043 RepID=V9DAT5_9EURO|nr:uncharacterized protein G647_03388 [Cladophialophora carrionii CBS 160.54]ETI24019.1 hypothetical protein G647_03388 [Cladophialophora carrionii CBS 160.54]
MGSSILTSLLANLSQLVPLSPPAQDELDLGLRQHFGTARAHQGRPLHLLSTSDTDQARSIFLTLHILFPHELLPALDLLDRQLVTKLIVDPFATKPDESAKVGGGEEPPANVAEVDDPAVPPNSGHEVFYIQSAFAAEKATGSRHRSRYSRASKTSANYEVQLDSWNCSCPAFSISAFQCLTLEPPADEQQQEDHAAPIQDSPTTARRWEFGGTETRKTGRVPSCKHIVAAVLAKAAPHLFKDSLTERVVRKEEVVAWGSGWGEIGG